MAWSWPWPFRRKPATDPHALVAAGEGEALATWLQGGDPDQADASGFTLLMSAASHDRPELARLLLQAGAGPDRVEDQDGATALFMAVTCGHSRVVELLLAAGASPNRCDHMGTSPLHMAVQETHQALVPRLLAAGACPDFKNAWGLTPLDIAEREGLAFALEALRGAGARPGGQLRMAEVLAALPAADRQAYQLPRAFGIKPEDPGLLAARDVALASLEQVDLALAAGLPARVKCLLKTAPDRAGEAIWARVLGAAPGRLQVELMARPAIAPDPEGPIWIGRTELTDWEVDQADGRIQGGFTERATLDHMAEEFGFLPAELQERRARYELS